MSAAAATLGARPAFAVDEWQPAHSPYLVALTVTLATFMEVLDTSIANVALPHIAGNLSASVDESTWVLTSYLVSNAIVLPLSGWLSSVFGRKRFYMTCVALFTISSALCGFAPNLRMLIFFRVLQGIGGGGLQPSEQAILYDTFPARKRAMGMALYGVAVVTAPIIGPTLGGWITDNYSWRWIFFINIPVGIVSLLLTSRMVSDPPHLVRRALKDTRIDFIGLGLLALGLGALQIVLDKGQREDWFQSSLIVLLTLTAVVGIASAVIWELKQREPLVDFRLLSNRNFAISTVMMFTLGFVLFGSTVLLPLFLQTLMGYSAVLSGMAISPGGILTMFAMPLVGWMIGHFDARKLIVAGLIIVSIGLFHMASFNLEIDFKTAMIARMIQAFGLAFLFVPINTMAYSTIPKKDANQASGLINLARNLGGSFGIAFVTTLLSRQAQAHQNMLVGHVTPYDPAYKNMMNQMTTVMHVNSADPVKATAQAHGVINGMLERQASMLSFVDAFWLLGAFAVVVIPLIVLMKRPTPGAEPVAVH